MPLKQMSVFLENRPGALTAPCRLLAEAGINIQTFVLADSEKFGILRLVVRDWERAEKLLSGAGFAVRLTDVLAIEIPDKPGGLADVWQVLEGAGINVEYMYAFTVKWEGKGLVIFRVREPEEALPALRSAGISVVDSAELGRRLG